MNRQIVSLVGAGLALMGTAEAVQAQASASPYTSATRYDAAGRVAGTISPNSPSHGYSGFLATRTTYDGAGRPIKVESGSLSSWQSEAVGPASWSGFTVYTTTESTYDAIGRKTKEWVRGSDDAIHSLIQYSYDSYGRLECTAVRMNPAVYGSLPGACQLGTEGAYGPDRITKNIYDPAGQLLQIKKAVGTGLEQNYATYTYTLNGRQASVTDANGNKAEVAYDGFDRQVAWKFPNKTTTGQVASCTIGTISEVSGVTGPSTSRSATDDCEKYWYDRSGNRAKLQKRDGSTLTYTFDNLNRMTAKVVPGSTTHTRDVYYGYDLRGLQTFARFDSTSGEGVTFVYDGFGRKTSETLAMDGVSRTLGSHYDANGNRTRLVYPDSNFIDFYRDGLDRLYYSALNGSSPLFYPWYDAAGRMNYLHGWTTSVAAWGHWQAFSYDPASRLSSVDNALAGASYDSTTTFTYNPAWQIASSTRTNDAYAWAGHVNVNRSYTANGLNQYSAVAGTSFSYDSNGNLTSDGTNSYTYDVENRLVTRSGGASATLRYDPLGRLYEVAGVGGTRRLLYDGDALVAEYASDGTLAERYVHGTGAGDDPLVWFSGFAVSDAARRYLYADERGSIVAVTDSSGNVLNVNTYDEFGIPGSSNAGRVQYTGQVWLPELGMYHYKARLYSPTLGRFMQTDPIGYEDQVNLYAYVGNDPVNGTDTSGMQEDQCDPSFDAIIETCIVNPLGRAKRSVENSLDDTRRAVENTPGNAGRELRDGTKCVFTVSCGDYVRVGRWMSEAELNDMLAEGRVQPPLDNSGQKFVDVGGDPEAFPQASSGSIYVRFKVHESTITISKEPNQDGHHWGRINGPGGIIDRNNRRSGRPGITEWPEAQNIWVTNHVKR